MKEDSVEGTKIEWDASSLSRRKLLEVGFWTLAGSGAIGTIGAGSRYLVGESLEPKDQKWVEVGIPEELGAGKIHRITYSVKGKDAWLNVERQGVVYAFSEDGESYIVLDATCTHLGCTVRWQEDKNHFACPCHAGIFSREGEVLEGPPPRPLVRLETKLEDGMLKALV